MKFCNHERERTAFTALRRPLRVPEMSVRTETCPKICQLEFRATKIAKALLADETNWQCSQALIGEAFAGSHISYDAHKTATMDGL